MIGRTLGHYRLLEKIGAGGMGEIYRARDEHLDRDVAVKILPAGLFGDESARKRFRKEALALSKLNHPNVATVHDFDNQEGMDFLVMEYVGGVSLAEKLGGGALPEKEVVRLGAQMAEALQEAHQQRVIHRDLKPGNIRLTARGEAKVLDFGLAKLLRPVDETATQSLTESRVLAGTLPYMAPEQLRGELADGRTDIYALGCVLYEMVTGQRPFQESLSTTLTDAILNRPAPPPGRLKPQMGADLERIILKCLEKDPENRYQSAKELLVDLRRLAAPAAPAVEPRTRAARHGLPRPWVWAIAGTLTLLATLFFANVGGLRERIARSLGSGAAPEIKSLAVLPLENLSSEPEQEYFADGMTEALITELSKISALKVISRTSAMRYKGTQKSMPEIARELGVDGVIEGSVLREGDQVRITVQLIHGPSDKHLWAESYQRELRSILALQSEVARAIASQIRVTLTPQEQARLASARPVNPEAYEAYLKGVYYWNRRTPEALQRSLRHFGEAVEKDPAYAAGYAGIANTYALLGYVGYGVLPPREAYPKARAAALKALEVDETLAEAHAALGQVKFSYDWDWAGGLAEYRKAIELNQSYATGHQWYGQALVRLGRIEGGLAEMRRAQEVDPLSLIIQVNLAWGYYHARQYDQALTVLRPALEMDPTFVSSHWALGINYTQLGRHREAIAAHQKAVGLSGGTPSNLAWLGYAYAVAGEKSAARTILQQLRELSKRRYVPPGWVALVYAGLGERDQAFQWLEQAYQERSALLLMLKVEPAFDSLRSDPRFQDLLRRMNLPD